MVERPDKQTECQKCHTPPFPRGLCRNLGLCWYCTFPRETNKRAWDK